MDAQKATLAVSACAAKFTRRKIGAMTRTVVRTLVVLAFPVVVFLGLGRLQSWHSGRDAALRAAGLSQRDTLNMRWHYDANDIDRFWNALQESGRTAERKFLQEDLIFPLFYGGSLAFSLLWLRPRTRLSWKPWLVVLPVVVGVVGDWTENLTQLSLLRGYIPQRPGSLNLTAVALSTFATDVKLGGITVATILLLVLTWLAIARPASARSTLDFAQLGTPANDARSRASTDARVPKPTKRY